MKGLLEGGFYFWTVALSLFITQNIFSLSLSFIYLICYCNVYQDAVQAALDDVDVEVIPTTAETQPMLVSTTAGTDANEGGPSENGGGENGRLTSCLGANWMRWEVKYSVVATLVVNIIEYSIKMLHWAQIL